MAHSGAESASIPGAAKAEISGQPRVPFVPVAGQSFGCEQEWVNRASRALTAHHEYRNTEHGETTGWRGPHFTALCFDQAGCRMRNGGDFKRATAEGTYPVWWVWPDQINDLLRVADSARCGPSGDAEAQPRSAQNPAPKTEGGQP